MRGGEGREKQIYRENCLKRGAWPVCSIKGGLVEGGVFLRGREG